MKVLILKPSSLGDVIQALPVLRSLRHHFPHARISWWIDEALVDLLRDDPDIQHLLPFPRRRLRSPSGLRDTFLTLRRMRRNRPDWTLDLQGLARSAAVARIAGARWTVGLEDFREFAPVFYDVSVPRPSPTTHAVDWYLETLRRLGVPARTDIEWIPPRPSARDSLERVWPREAVPRPTIGFVPGARWPNKVWPADAFRNTALLLSQRFPGVRIAVLGGPDDRDRARIILQDLPASSAVDLTGRTRLDESIEAIRRCSLVLSNDTGPMHIAAALGIPVVAMFGPTDPRRTGPYGQIPHALQAGLPCVPCLKPRCKNRVQLECLHALSPETAADAVSSLLPGASAR